MSPKRFHIGYEIPRGIMVQGCKWRGFTAAALIKEDEPPFLEIKEAGKGPF
jgi:hypothetical protein